MDRTYYRNIIGAARDMLELVDSGKVPPAMGNRLLASHLLRLCKALEEADELADRLHMAHIECEYLASQVEAMKRILAVTFADYTTSRNADAILTLAQSKD